MQRRPARVLAVLAALAIVAGLPVVLATTAEAHGTVIGPMTRAYSCWKRWGSRFQDPRMATEDPMCWQAWRADPNAMWNWNGLLRDGAGGNFRAAAPDGQLCSGGHTVGGRYAALDAPGPWTATRIPNPASFTAVLHDQALHGADFLRFYVTRNGYDPVTQPLRWSDLVLIKDTGRIPRAQGTRSSDPTLNGVSVATTLSAPGMTGRHVLFTIWQASHSDQSYYLCSDVVFGAGPATAPSATAPSGDETPMPNIAAQVERSPTPARATPSRRASSAARATPAATTATPSPAGAASPASRPAATTATSTPVAAADTPSRAGAGAASGSASGAASGAGGPAASPAVVTVQDAAAQEAAVQLRDEDGVSGWVLPGVGLLTGVAAGAFLPLLLRGRRRTATLSTA